MKREGRTALVTGGSGSAEEEGKPALCAITATRRLWRHVMDQTAYSDPGVPFCWQSGPERVTPAHGESLSALLWSGGKPLRTGRSLWGVGKHAKVGSSKHSVDAGGDDERTKLGG